MECEANRNGVRNERQLRTQRRIKVNAQITFVLWLMESLINTSIAIAMFAGGLGQTTFTLNMLLFLIILPYSYLNNTSYNKGRIAEEGWQNILKNILPCYSNKGRSNLTRVYEMSNDPVACENNSDVVTGSVTHNVSNSQTNNNPTLHVPTQEEHGDTSDTAEGQSQTEQVASSGMKNVTV